jgi:hypothetical protein
MINCVDCGKRKKIQTPNFVKTWRCTTCRKKTQSVNRSEKIEIQCFDCCKTIKIRKASLQVSNYYICGNCFKNNGTNSIDILREPEQIIIWKMNAAGEMNGFDIRYPTDEEKAQTEKAELILSEGLRQIEADKSDN